MREPAAAFQSTRVVGGQAPRRAAAPAVGTSGTMRWCVDPSGYWYRLSQLFYLSVLQARACDCPWWQSRHWVADTRLSLACRGHMHFLECDSFLCFSSWASSPVRGLLPFCLLSQLPPVSLSPRPLCCYPRLILRTRRATPGPQGSHI